MRMNVLPLIAIVAIAPACSSTRSDSAPDLADVSCDAKLTNQSSQTLTITSASSEPTGSKWSTSFTTGDQIKPGGSISSKITTVSECSASFTFQLADGRTFNATFDNRLFGDSTWSCGQLSGLKCAVTGNKTGQPLVVRYTLTDQ